MGSRDSNERKNRYRNRRETQSTLPQQIVCTAKDAASSNSVELGLLLSFLVVSLYLFACFESSVYLPSPNLNIRHQIGANLNVANMGGGSDSSADGFQKTIEQNDNASDGTVPFAAWPVKYKDEMDNYETITHPGDLTTEMKIPKFWSEPLHNNQQYTREQAMKVGTCIEPDPETGSYVRGDACPPNKRTIFVAIASYRDFQCRKTVESVFGRAQVCNFVKSRYKRKFHLFITSLLCIFFLQHPERIRVGTLSL
jgi:hypothetical protein